MGACYAFEVTADDVAAVLLRMGLGGNGVMERAEDALASLALDAVERAALEASTGL